MAREKCFYVCICLLVVANAFAGAAPPVAPAPAPQSEQAKSNVAVNDAAPDQQKPPQQQHLTQQEPPQQPAANANSDKAAAVVTPKAEEPKKAPLEPQEKHEAAKPADGAAEAEPDKEINIIEKAQHDSDMGESHKVAESVKKVLPSDDGTMDDVQSKLLDPYDDAIPTGFYFFFAISGVAVFIIVYRVFKLRVSRAERRYGVQGDRSNQELTPLPTSIEDVNSDEDDQTLFDRQQIRIF